MSSHPVTSFETSYRVRLDSRRRPTLPAALLEEADIDIENADLIARVDGRGRVVLEDSMTLLREVQEAMAAEMAARHDTRDLAMELIEERQLDASLR